MLGTTPAWVDHVVGGEACAGCAKGGSGEYGFEMAYTGLVRALVPRRLVLYNAIKNLIHIGKCFLKSSL